MPARVSTGSDPRLPHRNRRFRLINGLVATPASSGPNRYTNAIYSDDGGQTWPVKRLIEEGRFAYSSLSVGRPDTRSRGWIYLHYEGARRRPRGSLQPQLAHRRQLTGDGDPLQPRRPTGASIGFPKAASSFSDDAERLSFARNGGAFFRRAPQSISLVAAKRGRAGALSSVRGLGRRIAA